MALPRRPLTWTTGRPVRRHRLASPRRPDRQPFGGIAIRASGMSRSAHCRASQHPSLAEHGLEQRQASIARAPSAEARSTQ